ncbi:MAG: ECF-type sigma factor [Candidatus Krumholzibacteriia bacterium]
MPENALPATRVTLLLRAARDGDKAARERLFQTVYAEFHAIARRQMSHERSGHTLEPAGLVNEAMLRLLGREVLSYEDRQQFLRAASLVMRRVLVDHARARKAAKRGAGLQVTLQDEIAGPAPSPLDALELDRALTRLAAAEPRWAQVAELRFLLGLEVVEVASLLGVSTATVKRDWRFAKAWLARELGDGSPGDRRDG